jgi:hypothetical protein
MLHIPTVPGSAPHAGSSGQLCKRLDLLTAKMFIHPIDAKTYCAHLLAKHDAPTTINRALISLMLFFDTVSGTNPFRNSPDD